MNNNFWDMDKDGKFDIVDIFWIALQVLAYGGSVVLMAATFTRSFHLLSSPEFNPGVFPWWPYVAAASPELGLIVAWLAGEVGFRKGRLELVGAAILGGLIFSVVIGTAQLYDIALINHTDVSQAASWAQFVMSILPLITIAYLSICSMMLSYMARKERIRGGGQMFSKPSPSRWQVEEKRPKLNNDWTGEIEETRYPQVEHKSTVYGDKLIDPLTRSKRPLTTSANGGFTPSTFSNADEDFLSK